MRTLYWLTAAWALAFLGGCAELHRDRVSFDAGPECPSETVEGLARDQNTLGPRTPTRTLECALVFLRTTQDLALLRSPLGSRISLHLAERAADRERQEKLATEGVRFAEQAVGLGADGDGAVHYYLAANLGLAVRNDLPLALENLPRLEGEMKRAVDLNPEVDQGGPLRLLGMLYLKAPPWPGGIGDGDKALELLGRAVDQYPGHPLNHLFHAEALWEVEGDGAAEQARAEFAAGLKLLREGDWGFSKLPWEKEFAEAREDLGEAGRSGPAALSSR